MQRSSGPLGHYRKCAYRSEIKEPYTQIRILTSRENKGELIDMFQEGCSAKKSKCPIMRISGCDG